MKDFGIQVEGACWRQAAVQAGSCAQVLKDKRQLAWDFTNCHLSENGRQTAPHPSRMSDATFAIFTEFFTHTSDLCFQLQGEHYQQRANEALERLGNHAHGWLRAIEWARAIVAFAGGTMAIAIMGKAARTIDVPHALKWTKVALAIHVLVHALGTELTLVGVIMAAVTTKSWYL